MALSFKKKKEKEQLTDYVSLILIISFARLDFEAFSIVQPESVEHRCVSDSFVVTGTTSPVPVICGDNAGQHSMLITKKKFIITKYSFVANRFSIRSASVFEYRLQQYNAHYADDDNQ